MTFVVEYIDGHVFIDGVFGKVASKGYFYCNHPNCPFALKVTLQLVDGKKKVVGVESVICSVHYHETDDKSKGEVRKEIARDLMAIEKDKDSDEAKAAIQRHKRWHQEALLSSEAFKKGLKHKDVLREYIVSHPGASGKQVRDACVSDVDPHAICNMKRRMKGPATNLRDLLRDGGNHFLGNDGDDVVVFGRSSSFHYLATAPMLQGDGTFTCLVLPYTQLYIVHAVLANAVSFPMLYCLVKGKTQPIYERLLNLIERLAASRGMTVFNRPVKVMADFERPFINAVGQFNGGASIICLFFHFVSNVRKQA